MTNGSLIHGKTNLPLYGKNGTLLYGSPVSMHVDITISWSGGQDVDICGHYNVVSGEVGWSWCENGATIEQDGFSMTWDGDNTSGGPEYVHLSYSGGRSLADVKFYVHANWFRVNGEEEQGDGGTCTVTATDSKGTSKSYTFTPAQSHGSKATTGNPGVCLNFNHDGTLKSITAG